MSGCLAAEHWHCNYCPVIGLVGWQHVTPDQHVHAKHPEIWMADEERRYDRFSTVCTKEKQKA